MKKTVYEAPVGDPRAVRCSVCGGGRKVIASRVIACIICDLPQRWPVVQHYGP